MTTTQTRQGWTDTAGSPAAVATVATHVRDRARTMGDRVSLREKNLGYWNEVPWASYWDTVLTVGHGLLALGVEPGDRVAIHAENRTEWLYTDVATVAIRGTTIGLYPTNPPAEVGYLLSHSGAKVLVAEDQEQVDKALAVLDQCPDLERIVYLEPRGIRYHYDNPKLLAWDDLLKLGTEHRAAHPGAVESRMAEAMPDDIACLIYTSGTTGPPKGAMLSVANLNFAIKTLVEQRGLASPPANTSDIGLSYLPLCHIAERTFTIHQNAAGGVQMHFGESIATVQSDLREVQPTLLFGVPRIWERILAGVHIGLANAGAIKRYNARLWLKVADWIGSTLVRTGGRHTVATRLAYAVGWVFLYRALRERIGMRRVRFASSGAAPIAQEVLKFFMGIGVPMHEIYGMTENAAVTTINRTGRIKLGTVGEPHDGVEVRIDERTGEILTRHPAVFVGYFRDPEATAKAKDADGWLHTGDVGEWAPGPGGSTSDGHGTHVRITDRMKDIIITAGGKNISPSEIENALKASPFIKEAIVVGDRRPYLVALIGIELETVGDWAQRRGIAYTTYRDLSEKPEVLKLVQDIVTEVNSRFATVEQIKKFRMLPKELDHEDGELTATQKVKRSAIVKLFGELVEDMYRSGR
jgi:long-chain acyl-CoA synthetase